MNFSKPLARAGIEDRWCGISFISFLANASVFWNVPRRVATLKSSKMKEMIAYICQDIRSILFKYTIKSKLLFAVMVHLFYFINISEINKEPLLK